MSTSDTDLDDQLRAAMKVLDAEVPSGYFEALPDQTLSRLEATSMQGTSGTTENKVSAAPPPVASETTEDSGLHDIRNLAQSTKQRISSKRITSSQPVLDDPASSSGGWKAIALPQPAKMVALPELDELPSKKEIKAAEKAAAKERKVAEAAADVATGKAALPVDAAPARAAFSLPSAQKSQQKSKAPLIAMVGIGVAAAAAAVIFVTTQKKADRAPAPTVARAETAAAPPAAVTATPIEQNAAVGAAAGSAAMPADVQKAEDEAAKTQADNDAMRAQLAATQAAAGDTGKDKAAAAAPATTKAPAKAVKGHGASKVDTGAKKVDEVKQTPADKTDKAKPDATKADGKQKNADGSEPDFNDLLKEAGVNDKKEAKPKLEKKSLTGEDFKKGMSAIEDKAHACYKGTQGSAMVKLTVSPSGTITKIAISGPFSGKPEAACVAAAVRGASFPAWDGGPESFTYPILLSE